MSRTTKLALIFSLVLPMLFLGTQVFAATTGLPVVSGAPNPNDINTIPGLISYIYNLAFWLVGIAVFFQVFRAGFIIFFGAAGSASKVSEGKKIITNAIIGLILLFASWMILNVINPDLVKNTFDFGSLLQGSSDSGHSGTGTGTGSGTGTGTGTGNSGNPTSGSTISAGSCALNNVGNRSDGRCYIPSDCDQYQSAINQYARGSVTTPAFMRSIMWIESKCKSAAHSGAGAYGLMQFLVGTAQNIAQRQSVRQQCGITGTVNASWLTSQSTAAQQICLSVAYFNSDIAKYCDPLAGSKVRNYGGGYNAGQGRCVYCGSGGKYGGCAVQQSCDNATRRSWETATEANNYAASILYCLNHQ